MQILFSHFCRCGYLLEALSGECASCFELYLSSPSGISTCLIDPAYRYEKTYGGLMMISKKELKDTQASGYTDQSWYKGYLKATVSSSLHKHNILRKS